MPRKNSLKIYVEDGYYHLYNRGVEKRKIFLDDQDYRTFLFNLKKCLLPANEWEKDYSQLSRTLLGGLSGEIDLLTFCLMPNHFHLLVKQKTREAITKLMIKVGTSYSMYFNKRYNRVGGLFQGVYKAVMVKTDEQLLHVSRYIHLNPFQEGVKISKLEQYPYSSYPVYLGLKKIKWVKPEEILSFFNQRKKTRPGDLSYQSFVEAEAKDFTQVSSLLLD